MKRIKLAFTLVEVLIVVTIIGVTIALLIPTLLSSYNERTSVIKLKQSLAIFSQAYAMVKKESGDIDSLNIGTKDTADGAEKLHNYFKPFLKTEKDCGITQGCFATEYTALNSEVLFAWQPDSYDKYNKGLLSNGMSYAFWSAGSGCKNYPKGKNGNLLCGAIIVDVNGLLRPNRAGVDYFAFAITDKGIVPFGHTEGIFGEKCEYNDVSNTNGSYCTAWVIEHENLDYLRKPIEW